MFLGKNENPASATMKSQLIVNTISCDFFFYPTRTKQDKNGTKLKIKNHNIASPKKNPPRRNHCGERANL